MRQVALAAGVPALGQGTWHMGESRATHATEADALRLGLDLGLTVIDTAEMYADGGAETVVGDAIAGRRDAVFLVSKVMPQNASRRGVATAWARSAKRLRVEMIDLYLLHWRGSVPLAETVEALCALQAAGRVGRWGVSNFDVADMEELFALPGGADCAANQVLYNPEARGIEFDLLPWCRARGVAVMAYSPIGQGGGLLRAPALRQVAERQRVTPAQVAIAWSLRLEGVLSIPKSADPAHVRQNAAAAGLVLDAADLADIDAAFPPPRGRQPLEML